MALFNQTIAASTFVALDLETTGIRAATERIVEIGAIRFDWSGQSRQEFNTLVQPQRTIPDKVVAVHGITDDMVAHAPLFAQVATKLLDFLAGSVILAHNAAFDVGFLSCELRRAGFAIPQNLVLDTCRLSRQLLPESPKHRLTTLIRHLGIEPIGDSHRSIPDSWACAQIFRHCVQRLPQQEQTTLDHLLEMVPKIRTAFYLSAHQAEPYEPYRTRIIEAISQQQDLVIVYRNVKHHETERRVSPILLGGYGENSYLEAFCHLRQDQRQFRLDRITQMT